MKFFYLVFLLLITASLLFFCFSSLIYYIRSNRQKKQNEYPYRKKILFNNPESSLLRLLLKFSGNNYIVLSKVRLWDFIDTQKGLGNSDRCIYTNKINSKHIDFLLISPEDHHIILAIELDGMSHNSTRSIKNDRFKDCLFKTINIPLLRIKTNDDLNIVSLNELICSVLSSNDVSNGIAKESLA